jgi:Domain of unknown function (DUF5667)
MRHAVPTRYPAINDGIEAALGAMWSAVEPDPLFRRRLRSQAVNRYVAVREGMDQPVPMPSDRGVMGGLGKACLYASFVLGVSATSILAASHEAVPGDALYALKVRIEQVRIQVLPEHLHDDLYASVLGERISEMSRLTERGETQAAMEMVPVIEEAYATYAASLGQDAAITLGDIKDNLVVLKALIDRLPDGPQAAIQDVIQRANQRSGIESVIGTDEGEAEAGPNGAGRGPITDEGPRPDPPGQVDAAPRPERTPRPEATTKPQASPNGQPHGSGPDGSPNGPQDGGAD